MFIGVTAYNLFCCRWSRRRAGSVGAALFAMFVAGTLVGPDLRVWKTPARPGAGRTGRRHGGDPQLRPGRRGP